MLHQQPQQPQAAANNWIAIVGQQPLQPLQHLLCAEREGVESGVCCHTELELADWEGPGPEEIMGLAGWMFYGSTSFDLSLLSRP